MQMVNIRSNSFKKCAFCKFWYDPTNSVIRPKSPSVGFWEFDERQKAQCMERNTETASAYFCSKFACKV